MVTLNSSVELKDDVIFQPLGGEAVILNLRTEIYFGLDRVGTEIWQFLQEDKIVRTVVYKLLDKYDISEEQLANRLFEFIEKLEAKGLVAVHNA